MILFDVFFGKLFNFNIFIMIKYLGSNGKKMGRYAKCNFNRIPVIVLIINEWHSRLFVTFTVQVHVGIKNGHITK